MDIKGKKVLVCGMAKSGISAARLLHQKGALVTLQDLKKKEELKEAEKLENEGITLYVGKNPDDIIVNQDLIVVSPGIPCDLSFIKLAKEKEIPVISEVELSYFFCPCPIAAITGTNGKTTTTTLAGEMIKAAYPNSAVVGNIGVPFSGEVLRLLKEDWVVAEISSFQMETSFQFHPKVSAVLNITPDHLNRHKTMENYVSMKERVFQNQTEEDYCILNADDPYCQKMEQKTKAQVLFFSSTHILEKGIYLKDGEIKLRAFGYDETLLKVEELQILGVHNYENVMAAALVALCAGVSLNVIREVLKRFQGVCHRIEYVATVKGVDYYNDSKGTNPDAAIRGVKAMVKPTVLIGGGYDKSSSYDEWVETFPGKVKHLVLIGETAPKIEACCFKHGFTDISHAKDLKEAVKLCSSLAKEGDAVLLSPACASWDMFESYEQRGDMFKSFVKEL